VRYEDLRGSGYYDSDIRSRAFTHLLKLPVDLGALGWALEVNAFERMRAKERATKGEGDETRLRVRSGRARDALAALDGDAAHYVESYLAEHLDPRWTYYLPPAGRVRYGH